MPTKSAGAILEAYKPAARCYIIRLIDIPLFMKVVPSISRLEIAVVPPAPVAGHHA